MKLIPGLRSNPSYFISITVSRKERNSRSQFPNRAVSELFNEKSRVCQLGSGNRVTLKISDWERKKVDNRIKREKERFLSETWQDPAKSADAGNRRNSNMQFFSRMQSYYKHKAVIHLTLRQLARPNFEAQRLVKNIQSNKKDSKDNFGSILLI